MQGSVLRVHSLRGCGNFTASSLNLIATGGKQLQAELPLRVQAVWKRPEILVLAIPPWAKLL